MSRLGIAHQIRRADLNYNADTRNLFTSASDCGIPAGFFPIQVHVRRRGFEHATTDNALHYVWFRKVHEERDDEHGCQELVSVTYASTATDRAAAEITLTVFND